MPIPIDIGTDRVARLFGVTAPLVKRFYFEGMQDEVLPELRRRVPRRTGKLRNSLRFVRYGQEVQLKGIRYAPYVRFKLPLGKGYKRTGNLRTVKAVVEHLQRVNHARLLRKAINKTLQTGRTV